MIFNALKAPLFTVGLVGLFMWAGEAVTRASGGPAAALGEGVSLENGEQIFWGTGKCHTCHTVGTRGKAVRGPNLGQWEKGPEIALRALDRAKEREAKLGKPMTATGYLVESLADPTAYVVDGYKGEMPKTYDPPISLTGDQITSVVLYLQSLGGTPDPTAVVLPPAVREAGQRRTAVTPWKPYLEGDSARGRALFFDPRSRAPCAKCHRVGERGGTVGPELTTVAGTRSAEYIIQSMLDPSKEIASGFEAVMIQTTDGRILDGIIRKETDESLVLGTSDGKEVSLRKADVERRAIQEVSLMPDNFGEMLTVRDLHDLLAFLLTLQ